MYCDAFICVFLLQGERERRLKKEMRRTHEWRRQTQKTRRGKSIFLWHVVIFEFHLSLTLALSLWLHRSCVEVRTRDKTSQSTARTRQVLRVSDIHRHREHRERRVTWKREPGKRCFYESQASFFWVSCSCFFLLSIYLSSHSQENVTWRQKRSPLIIVSYRDKE